MRENDEKCYFCGHGLLKKQRVTMDLRKGDRLVVIKNVAALVCDTCGERQYSIEVSQQIDRIWEELEHTGQAEEEMKVPVVSMA